MRFIFYYFVELFVINFYKLVLHSYECYYMAFFIRQTKKTDHLGDQSFYLFFISVLRTLHFLLQHTLHLQQDHQK